MKFGKDVETTNTPVVVETQVEQPFDMSQTQALVVAEASQNKAEILALTDRLDLGNPTTLVTFGKEAVDEISKCSDTILNNVEMDKITGAGALIKTLTVIMDKFDIKELSEEKQGFLAKLFSNAKAELEKILNKYNTMGGEIEKIYMELKKYEVEINDSNKNLEKLFDNNVDFYKSLTKYILAGEEGCRLIREERARVEALYLETNNQEYQLQLQNLDMGLQVLEQRVQDLRIAENVALQSIPMIKAMQFSNMNLSRKINSAFIITLPIFKQSLAQAVLLKRQKVQADALAALDEKTNEMLLKNAQNTVDSVKLTTQLASSSSVKMETLEQTWQTIMRGIEETQQIQVEAERKRAEDKVRLEALKQEYKSGSVQLTGGTSTQALPSNN